MSLVTQLLLYQFYPEHNINATTECTHIMRSFQDHQAEHQDFVRMSPRANQSSHNVIGTTGCFKISLGIQRV
jgi:hypothetical protein